MRQGYVSATAAAELYGVIIEPQTFAVDEKATEKKRVEMALAVNTG